ncbi:cytoskeletal protein RodZ [Bacillus tianshenii]|uniref:Cytoskeletal protein RodZ n=1 Tax=Sutcliffiella tianshenii TaxID=1463404 RepID=A0ABS2NWM3_9BACI|nr:cytoskeletal protein RodZ [Bacillus tianshenii]
MTELGNRLKQEREAKKMSLEDLQTTTKIQKRYLIGVEEGNYSIMPGQFYARAFIKQYAEAVGLDPEEIFEEYKNDIPVNEKEDIPQLSRVKTRKQVPAKSTKSWKFLPILFTILAIVAICAIVYTVVISLSGGDGNEANQAAQDTQPAEIDSPNQAAQPEEEEKAPAEEEKAPEEEKPAEEEAPAAGTLKELEKSGSNATLELSGTDKFVVELSSPGETWIEIDNDKGKNFHYGLVKKGEEVKQIDLSQEAEVSFKVGRTFETDLKINGEPFKFPFPTNEKTTQTFTIKFVKNGEQ